MAQTGATPAFITRLHLRSTSVCVMGLCRQQAADRHPHPEAKDDLSPPPLPANEPARVDPPPIAERGLQMKSPMPETAAVERGQPPEMSSNVEWADNLSEEGEEGDDMDDHAHEINIWRGKNVHKHLGAGLSLVLASGSERARTPGDGAVVAGWEE